MKHNREWWLEEAAYIECVWAAWGTGNYHCRQFDSDPEVFNRYVSMQANACTHDGYPDIGQLIRIREV